MKAKTREPQKKYFKIVVRKLPVNKYTETDFQSDIIKLCGKLGVESTSIRYEHFMRGKISRQRGPVPGVGFLSVTDEDIACTILSSCPTQHPFLDGDLGQPELRLAPYQKTFRIKEKVDKQSGTYETDPEFLAFVSRMEAPVPKRGVAEPSGEKKPSADTDPRQSALMRFLLGRGAAGAASRKKILLKKDKEKDKDTGGKNKEKGENKKDRGKNKEKKEKSSRKDKSKDPEKSDRTSVDKSSSDRRDKSEKYEKSEKLGRRPKHDITEKTNKLADDNASSRTPGPLFKILAKVNQSTTISTTTNASGQLTATTATSSSAPIITATTVPKTAMEPKTSTALSEVTEKATSESLRGRGGGSRKEGRGQRQERTDRGDGDRDSREARKAPVRDRDSREARKPTVGDRDNREVREPLGVVSSGASAEGGGGRREEKGGDTRRTSGRGRGKGRSGGRAESGDADSDPSSNAKT